MTYFPKRKTKRELIEATTRKHGELARASMPQNNTLDFEDLDGNRIIRLHSTDILTFPKRGGWKIDTRGYNTKTTKERLNEYLPRGFYVFQRNYGFYIHERGTGRELPFSAVVTCGARGKLTTDCEESK